MTDLVTTETFDRVEQRLRSDRRLVFLAELLYELSLGMRATYPAAGTEAYRAVAAFICHNELVQTLAESLRSSLNGRGHGYPDAALLASLAGDARIWGCDRPFERALAQSLKNVAGSSRDVTTAAEIGLHQQAVVELASSDRLPFIIELATAIAAEAQSLEPPPDVSHRALEPLIEYITLQRRAVDLFRTALKSDSDIAARLLIDPTIGDSPEKRGDALMRTAVERALKTVDVNSRVMRRPAVQRADAG